MSGSSPQCSSARKRPVRPSPVCTSSQTNSAPCSRHSALRARRGSPAAAGSTPLPCTGSTTNAATSPARSSRSSAPASPNGTAAPPGSNGPKPSRNSALPLSASAPVVSPWKPCSQWTIRARPVASRASLIAASTVSVPVLVEHHVPEVRRRAREQLLGQHARQQRHAELRQVRRVRRQHRLELRADARVVAPDREHAVAGEHVQVALAALVDQLRALGAAPAAVEAQRAHDAPELRVQMAIVERQLLTRPRLQQRGDVDARHAADYRAALQGASASRVSVPLG